MDGLNPEDIKAQVADLPYMSLKQAKEITGFLRRNRLTRVLELGFYHGVSSCYLAAAMKSLGGEPIVTIDLLKAKQRDPSIEDLLRRCDLLDYAEVYFEPTSYNWRLMNFIETGRRFDFCYIDGGHDWYNTGFAFFLVDKLIEPGGWILFDDLDWTMEHVDAHWALSRPPEERRTPQVRKVWELLVQQHPGYGNFREDGRWGFARKKTKQTKAMRHS
ncbi:MAG: class I SAM-dependent methyltransferase [Alphaproteobacteria bacterium]